MVGGGEEGGLIGPSVNGYKTEVIIDTLVTVAKHTEASKSDYGQ